MKIKIKVVTIFNCTLERAFKTPILCDVTKIHTGYGIMPRVTHCTDDQNWGRPGSTKKVFVAKSLTQKGGWASEDKIIERKENEYWKIEVDNFQSWMLGFSKFSGEWKTTEIEKNKILVEYSYTLYFGNFLLYPLNWLFAKLFWKAYMKKIIRNIKELAYRSESYNYK